MGYKREGWRIHRDRGREREHSATSERHEIYAWEGRDIVHIDMGEGERITGR